MLQSQAQINPKIYLDNDEFPSLLKRKLIVALKEEDPDIIKKLEKKEKSSAIEEYRKDIKEFNEYLKFGMDKYWKQNSSYEFKTISEVKALMKDEKKSGSSKYVVLFPDYLGDTETDFLLKSGLTVPIFSWMKAEGNTEKPDYKIYIPDFSLREQIKCTQTDISLALIL